MCSCGLWSLDVAHCSARARALGKYTCTHHCAFTSAILTNFHGRSGEVLRGKVRLREVEKLTETQD